MCSVLYMTNAATVAPSIDLSVVATLSDDELAAALELFAAEIARRETLAATCYDASCGAATSHVQECECTCGGSGHGRDHVASRAAAIVSLETRVRRTGDVTLGASRPAACDDKADEAFGFGPIRRNTAFVPDPDDAF
jgi:hypothetical protein